MSYNTLIYSYICFYYSIRRKLQICGSHTEYSTGIAFTSGIRLLLMYFSFTIKLWKESRQIQSGIFIELLINTIWIE